MRPLNPDHSENLKEQLDMWIQKGIIEPANSPWASPLVPVKKKVGRTRWVTDLRQHQSIWYILAHKDAVWTVERWKRQQLDVGLGPCPSASGVLVIVLDNILVYSMNTWDHLKHLMSIRRPT